MDDSSSATRAVDRRRALQLLGGAGLLALVGCSSSTEEPAAPSSPSTTSTTPTTSSSAAAGAAIPEETAGPFPGDGSNGPDALAMDGIVRRDLTTSLVGSGVATGVALTVELTVTDAGSGEPLAGAAVYAWHCDKDGRYSMYSEGVTAETWLRGVQEAGSDGTLAFDTVFPGAYPGRWPHIHFEVYGSLQEATGDGVPVATSQLALPQDTCAAVYGEPAYRASASTFAGTSISDDMVFADGADRQTASTSGDVGGGLTAQLTVPV